MELKGKNAVVTGGVSGIGQSVAQELARRGVERVAVVDLSDNVEEFCLSSNHDLGWESLVPFRGDVTSRDFRESVFAEMESRFGPVSLCVPAAGITRDRLCVKVARDNGSPRVEIYSEEEFRRVIDIDLIAPIYWGLRTVGSVALDRARKGKGSWKPEEGVQGGIVLIGSVSSAGNRGQISYATAKAGLEGAQATMAIEAIYHGVRCAIIHPGYTDTPMVRALGEDLIKNVIIPSTQLKRLIRPSEIANAICFMLENSSVSGALWADAGWHPTL